VRATLTREQTAAGVEERVRAVANELGVRDVIVHNVLPIGRAKEMDGVSEISIPKPGIDESSRLNGRESCGLGSSVHITPEGDVYPCWALAEMEEEAPLGNVSDGFKDVVRDYLWGESHDRCSVDCNPRCGDCEVRYLCGGICRAFRDGDCSALRERYIRIVEDARASLQQEKPNSA
jgi:uncharacterized protein